MINEDKSYIYDNTLLERLKHEQISLDIKIDKLIKFIESSKFQTVDSTNQDLLFQQYEYMELYNSILKQRIKLKEME